MKINRNLAPIPLALSIALTGCIEVDDDSNDGVIDALNQQNTILAEQNQLLSDQVDNETFTVTFAGIVVNVGTDAPAANAVVSVLQGDTVIVDGIEAVDGKFTVEGLPASSDLIILVSSTDESLLPRAFFVNTSSASGGDVYSDIGELSVSEPVDVSFSIVNEASGEFITGLSFTGYSYSGEPGSTAFDYLHQSTYNTETNQYDITLPKDLYVTLTANVDLDDDGEPDFEIESSSVGSTSGNLLYLNQANTFEDEELVLTPSVDDVVEDKLISISLIDANGSIVEGAVFSMQGEEGIESTYNDAEEAYTVTVPFDGNVQLSMPSLTVNDTTYSSGYIWVNQSTDNSTGEVSLNIQTSGYDSNSYYTIADSDTVSIVLLAREVEAQSNLEVVTSSINSETFAYSVYYSEAVTLDESEASLSYNEVSITLGNESDSDSVPAGYTYINSNETSVPLALSEALNGTKQTLTPDAELTSNTEYTYTIGSVSAQSDEIDVEFYEDDYTFVTPVSGAEVFDINDVIIDNENYYSNGTIIVPENTAGQLSSVSDWSSSVYMYFPVSINTLNYLIISTRGYNEGGTPYPLSDRYAIVFDGDINISKSMALKVADNENVSNNANVNYVRGTSIDSGIFKYRRYMGVYSSDNTASYQSTVTFSYEYQTLAGEQESGTITLPVQ